MNNKLYIGRIFILVGKLSLGLTLALIIYVFYKFLSISDVKVTIAFFEAKFMSLFSNFYKVAYTNKQGVRVENYIPIFLNDPYVKQILLKYKLALYNGFNLAFFMLSMIIVVIFYYRSEIRSIIEDFKYQLLKERKQVSKNDPESLRPKIFAQKNDSKPIEYQDL